VSERTLKRLVGALVVLVGVWLVSMLFSGGSGSISASGEMVDFFDGIDATTLEAVRMVRGDSAVVLERTGEAWTANGYVADSASVQRLLDALPRLVVGDLAATNPQNHARMGVSTDSAVAVELVTGAGSRTVLVGDAGRRFGTAYVRLPGADEVYLLDGDLRAEVRRPLDQWRNRTMVAIDTALVVRVEIEKEGDAYALVRSDSTWTFENGDSVQTNAVRGILSELSRLVASGFTEPSDSISGLERSSTTRAFGAGGQQLAEITIGAGSGDRWARSSGDDTVYRVSSFRADRVAPSREDVETES